MTTLAAAKRHISKALREIEYPSCLACDMDETFDNEPIHSRECLVVRIRKVMEEK